MATDSEYLLRTTFELVLLSYFFTYDVIVEPPTVVSTTVKHRHIVLWRPCRIV